MSNPLKKLAIGLKKFGLGGSLINLFEQKLQLQLPLPTKLRWRWSIKSELYFWDSYFEKFDSSTDSEFKNRLNPSLCLQENLVRLLPENQELINILDVGAGPITFVGKTVPNRKISVIAVDPLAKEYAKILDEHSINPPVRTVEGDAENLTSIYSANTFDLVCARNCIDHAYSPENAILEMIKVAKRNCYVFLQHVPNEAINQNWAGLHSWNFSELNGDFIISSKHTNVNFTKKYTAICAINTTLSKDGEWIFTEIKKL